MIKLLNFKAKERTLITYRQKKEEKKEEEIPALPLTSMQHYLMTEFNFPPPKECRGKNMCDQEYYIQSCCHLNRKVTGQIYLNMKKLRKYNTHNTM